MDVNEHEKLSNITLRHNLRYVYATNEFNIKCCRRIKAESIKRYFLGRQSIYTTSTLDTSMRWLVRRNFIAIGNGINSYAMF